MNRLMLILPILLMGCDPKTDYVPVRIDVPAQLLEPTPISERQAKTYRDLAILATEHRNSAEQANADKAAIKEIIGDQ